MATTNEKNGCEHSSDAATCEELCACGDPCRGHAAASSLEGGGLLCTGKCLQPFCNCERFLLPHNFATVAASGDGGVTFIVPPKQRLTKGEAALLAAWLLAVAHDHDGYFAEALKIVRGS